MMLKKIYIACILVFSTALALFAKGGQEQAYTEGGEKSASITIKVPQAAKELPPSLSNIHILAYSRLLSNFSRYLTVRPDLDFDTSMYKELLSGYYDDNDEAGRDVGHLSATDYLMTGSITQSSLGYHFSLQIAKTARDEKSVPSVFSQNCTWSELSNLSIVNRASLYLLEQMGVKLTEKARMEFEGAVSTNRTKGQTIMREAVAAQESGDDARARVLFNQAKELDAQLAQEAERRLSAMDKPLAMLSAETILPPTPLPPPPLQTFVPTPEKQAPPPAKTTGNLGNDARARQQAYEIEQENERIRNEIEAENARIRAENERRQKEVEAENERQRREVEAENERRRAVVAAENAARDAHNREIWVKTLRDSEEYYRNYLAANTPVELVYENKIEAMPETHDYVNKTESAKFNAALVPVESGWSRAVENTVSDLRKQLLATGRAEAWGLADWPQTAVTSPPPFSSRTGSVEADAELLDENGRVLGTQSFSITWNLTVSFSGKGVSLDIDLDSLQSYPVVFENIRIDDITDTLQIRIAKINDQNAETAAAQGGIQYSTNWRRWIPIARRQQSREAARKRQTALQAAADKFLDNAGIGFGGWGGAYDTGDVRSGGGGGDIELRLSRYFGLQTGFQIFQDVDTSLSEPIETQTIIQLPVLVKFHVLSGGQFYSGKISSDNVIKYAYVFSLSPYAGIGINQFSNNDNIAVQSSSHLSLIMGGEVNILAIFFVGFQYNRDFSNTVYSFDDRSFSYSGTRNIWYGGMRFFIPFRKK